MTFTKSYNTFNYFPQLPPEVREMVWNSIATEPRIVELRFSSMYGIYGSAQVPAELKVNQESRRILLRMYPLSFGNYLQPAKTPFNFDIDTIYIHEHFYPHTLQLFSTLTPTEIANIRNIAIPEFIEECPESEHAPINLYRLLRQTLPHLPQVRCIIVTCNLTVHFDDFGRRPAHLNNVFFDDNFPDEFIHYCTALATTEKCEHAECRTDVCEEALMEGPCGCFGLPVPKESHRRLGKIKRVFKWDWR